MFYRRSTESMNSILHKASSRGRSKHDWLDSYHSFSFAEYHNPGRMNFGILRVLNDDIIAGGTGFGRHPHNNMEIITIPLHGDLAHEDSMGNKAIIKQGDVQVMSAGTGVYHSERNPNKELPVELLQIWLMPNQRDVAPRYDQISIAQLEKQNSFFQILSPNPDDQGVWIHQNAWFHLGYFDENVTTSYNLKNADNGVYVFVLEGQVEIVSHDLDRRDAIGIWDIENFVLKSNTKSKVLVMEIPLAL